MGEIRRQLRSGTVWSAKDDFSPLDGLRRAAERATSEQLAAWAEELVPLLRSSSLVLRTRAIAALDSLPCDPLVVLEILQSRPALFDEYAEGYPLFPPHLEDAIWYWLADKPPVTNEVRSRLSVQPILVVYLAEHDHEWVLENARQVVAREVLGGVLISFPPDQRAALLRVLGPWDDAMAVLEESWWKRIEDATPLRSIIALG